MNKSPAAVQLDAEQLDDGISSIASEFVDATQMAHEDSDGTEQIETSKSSTISQTISFL
jgi:hypothetical protein